MKFTISRKNWLRGEGFSGSQLLRFSDKKMCCLGFFCIAKGASEEEIMSRNLPSDIFYHDESGISKFPDWCRTADNPIIEKFVEANDFPIDSATSHPEEYEWYNFRSEEEREAEIKKLFALQGYEVDFVD